MKTGRKTKQSKQLPARLKKRTLAYLVDLMLEITVLGGFLLSAQVYYVQDPQNPQGSFQMLCFLITYLLLFLYIPYRYKGQTIGKRVMHIRVISDTGKTIQAWKLCIRDGVMKLMLAMVLIPAELLFEAYYLIRYHKHLEYLPHDILLHTKVIEA